MKRVKLKESDINRIVFKIKNKSNDDLNEGLKDLWSGLKGMYKGYGYKYAKNLGALQNIVDDLAYSEKFLNQVRKKCDRIVNDVTTSKMPDEKMNQIVDIVNDIIIVIDRYEHDMDVISDDVRRKIK